ncbi:MAG: hypothetical protein H6509_03310 [Bryobacterales bacterium]|nr:hypothetical protein [Bryobacterales bacterium]
MRWLTETWRQKYPKRAFGGTWALAGYSFQAAHFLFGFYQKLIREEDLPTIEELSDIVCPSGDLIHVVQVKRTLTRAALRHALEEFRDILQLLKEAPNETALDAIRFQVASKVTDSNVVWPWPEGVALDDELRAILPEIEARAAAPFLVEQADPIDEMWALLWLQGVRDPQSVIRQGAGRLIDGFGRSERAPEIHRDLISYYEQAPRRSAGARPGRLIAPADVTPSASAETSRRIVVSGDFGFKDLREGCFRDRPKLFEALWRAFDAWRRSLEERLEEREIPIFWIDGRSGDGKSVLLRQLVAHAVLQVADRRPIAEVARKQLPEALLQCQTLSERQIMLMVDDPYAVTDRETWGEDLAAAVEGDLAPAAIVVCGPTEQREEFERRFRHPFRLTTFTTPHLGDPERREFIDWFHDRTGRQRETRLTENALLVHVMFELAENATLDQFARRFRRRLDKIGALRVAERILALSALYIETPNTLIAGQGEGDAIRRLSEEDQRHFRQSTEGVDFAHAHLAGEILRPILESSYPQVSWEVAWARVLSEVLESPRLESKLQRTLIGRFIQTPRLSEDERRRALREAYHRQVTAHAGAPQPELLPVWLTAMSRDPNLAFEPSPIEAALTLIKDGQSALPGSVATALWGLADRIPMEREDVDEACWRFLCTSPDAGAAFAFLRASSRSAEQHHLRAKQWLQEWGSHPQAHNLLAPLVKGAPEDGEIRRLALDWLESNLVHPQAYNLLAALVAGAPQDGEIRRLALDWLERNSEQPQAYELLKSLVAGAPQDGEIRRLALDWLERNPDHRQAYELLAPLVKGAPEDVEIRRLALDWLESNSEHRQAYELLAPLVKGAPEDVEIRRLALDWLESNSKHPQVYWLLKSLVAGAPQDVEIRRLALDWLESNSDHPQAYELLAPLVARCPDTELEDTLQLAFRFLETAGHVAATRILAVMVTRSRLASDVVDAVLDFLDSNPPKAQANFLLMSLRKACSYNLGVALDYIAFAVGRDGLVVARAVAAAVAKWPERHDDLEIALQGRSSELTFRVLGACVRARIQTPELIRMAASALHTHFRRTGYGSFLWDVRRASGFWQDLAPAVNPAVRADYVRLDSPRR